MHVRECKLGPALAKPKPAPKSIEIQLAALALFVLVAFFAMIRFRLLDLPLERDEGEYAYAGQLILHGLAPYKLLYNMKWPGTYAAYALLMGIFGETIAGIRIGLMIVTTATALCTYLLTKRMFGHVAGVVAAAAELMLSITIPAMGPYGHATHFVALFAVAGCIFLLPARGEKVPQADEGPRSLPILGAGALLGLAALMKQPGMFFGFFAVIWLLTSKRWKDSALVAGGASIIAALTVAIIAIAGVWSQFKLWTIDYARQYVSEMTVAQGLQNFKDNFGPIFSFTFLLWVIALAGLVLLFVDPEARKHWRFVVSFTLAGVFATMPGLYFRQHYLIVLFPAIAMLNGIAVKSASRLLGWRAVPSVVYGIAFLITLGQQWPLLMAADSMAITRALYSDNPFPEAIEVADYIKENSGPDDRIAILGSEPEIYFYSGRRSATGYIYTYPLMERQPFAHHMQEEMIAEIERAKPKYIVTVSVAKSWLAHPDSDRTIFNWMQPYMTASYVIDGIADMQPSGTQYMWGADARTYRAKTRNLLMLFKRK